MRARSLSTLDMARIAVRIRRSPELVRRVYRGDPRVLPQNWEAVDEGAAEEALPRPPRQADRAA